MLDSISIAGELNISEVKANFTVRDQLNDFLTDNNFLYKKIFENLCMENLEKENEYNSLLRLYQNNYRYVVLLIENEHLKTEINNLNESTK